MTTFDEVQSRLSDLVDQCRTGGPVVITRKGKAVAVLLAPANKDDLERLILAHSPQFQALLEKSRRSIREGRGLTADEFWKTAAEHRRKKSAGKKK